MNNFFLVIFIIFSSNCFSQVIKGKLVDLKEEIPLSYGIVEIENGTKVTITDTLGNFIIKIEQGDTIKLSYLGYPTSIIYNINSLKDTIDFGDIHLINVIKEQKPKKRRLFKRKKVYWECEVIETINLKDLKQENLTMKCPSGKVKYKWKLMGEGNLKLDFYDINFCK